MIKSLPNKLFFLFAFLISTQLAFGQNFTLNGKVVNENNIGLANVTVQILNSNHSGQTNENGDFSFNHITKGFHTIRFTSLGYASENRTISIDNNITIEVELAQISNRLDEAVVTAYKQENDPQELPLSLSVFDEKKVEDHHIWNIKDITAMVPNLNSSNPGDNRNVTSIRGITTTSYNQAITTYVDGVSQFNLDTYIPYLQDVERIEVLRGPQGTLYGRNAMGGVINIITKKPTNQQSISAEINLGNHGQQRYLLGLRTPLVKDKLFFGASGLYNKLDGFYTNDFNDSNYDKQHTTFGNFFLKYLPNEHWTMTLNYKQVANRNNGAYPLVFGKEDALNNPFHLSQNALTEMVDNTTNASLSLNHYGNAVNFSSQTAYQSNQRYYKEPIDSDFSPYDAITLINNYGKDWNNVKVFTQELKLSSVTNSISPLSWTGGAYLFHQDQPEKQGIHSGNDSAPEDAGTTSILTNKSLRNGIALFGQVGYKLLSDLQILAGIRYDYEHVKHNGSEELELANSDIETIQPNISGSASFHAFTPNVSLRYDLGEESNIYGSYSRGFRAGGLSPIASTEDNQPALRSFKPEYSNNFEIGSKNVFLDHKLQVNIAAFYTRVYDAQVPTLILPDAVTLTQNTGRMNSKGIELEVNAKALSNLDIFANLAYTHARYTDLNIGQEGENVQLKGNRPIYTPDWTSMLGAKYTYSFGKEKSQSIIINTYGQFLGRQYFDLNNTIDQKAYSLLNANVGYENNGYSVTVWGQNLANTTYLDYAYDFGAVHLGNPVTYGVTLRKSFNGKIF
ncbi:TonB-dependent receptor [Albibacterium bauzanense]|uniref:Iron complex outermembrane receptor protein n=1 Tax=Albibacterium bauzanense TaxID=653929 RepID=A0A4R1LUC2_9SPHI|nr:TonB-dependent receptor [Albibacterium bauzanense]TCK80753.1 iron complex outermembrane receptor protein [Albibacterium bauzanense]